MSTAACLAIILAYATEEETVYRRRERSVWTKKNWLKRRSVFGHGNLINDELVTWYISSQTCPHTLQIVAQRDCCATKFKPA